MSIILNENMLHANEKEEWRASPVCKADYVTSSLKLFKELSILTHVCIMVRDHFLFEEPASKPTIEDCRKLIGNDQKSGENTNVGVQCVSE